jgi:hypothetical protein
MLDLSQVEKLPLYPGHGSRVWAREVKTACLPLAPGRLGWFLEGRGTLSRRRGSARLGEDRVTPTRLGAVRK